MPLPAKPTLELTLLPSSLLLVLTALVAFQPAGTDVYLPSLPAIATEFGVGPVGVQWTLTVFLVAFSSAQLAAGPIADRFGRRPVILAGQLSFILASLVGAFAPSLAWLIAARAAQAVGACCAVVCARAMIRDLFTPATGAQVMSRMLGWMVVVPVLGVALGGLLQQSWGWRANFLAVAAYGLMALLFTLRWSRETLPLERRTSLEPRELWFNGREIFKSRTFQAWLVMASWSYVGLFAYLSNSSFALIQVLGLSPTLYGLSFGVTALGYLMGVLWVRRRIGILGLRDAPSVGAALAAGCGLAMAILSALDVQHPAAIMIPMFGYMLAHGINQPCATSGAVGPFPHCAGTAAALLGALMAAGAAPMGWVIAANHDGTTRPLAFAMGLCGIGVAASWLLLVRKLPPEST